MSAVDRLTIDQHGVPGVELMERAGRRVVETIQERWEGLEGLAVAVVCGKGNNGGDGFVVARLLHDRGVVVRAYLAAHRDALTPGAAHHCGLLEEAGISVDPVPTTSARQEFARADIVIDALLGTGLKGAVRGARAGVIEAMNSAARPIIAVDLPTGVEADTGKVNGPCVRAAVTVTFGLPKVGHLFYPGRTYCGHLELVDIGFPLEAIEAGARGSMYLLTEKGTASLIPRRSPQAHKGSCGSALVIAGSEGMTGAAALTADSALAVGAGRVSLGIPAGLNDIMEVKLTEVMTRPLPEVRKRRCLSLRAAGDIERLAAVADCLAIGPGLGTYRETVALVRKLVAGLTLPMVIDADGLNAFVGYTDILKQNPSPLVLTPHLGEFARLTGTDTRELGDCPAEHARRFARDFALTLILKGAPTVIACADGSVFVNPTGNAGMATAGSGDVLTGVLAGLMAQGLSAPDAACVGVFVHGRAGDIARQRMGEWGMKAGDIDRCVPEAILAVSESGSDGP
jgi:NAD(P)H-hydrate epimerase